MINALQQGGSPYDKEFIPNGGARASGVAGHKIPKDASGAGQLSSGFIGRTWLDKSAALARYLRGGASERKARPSYYSVRSLRRMLLWLQRPILESRLSEMWSKNRFWTCSDPQFDLTENSILQSVTYVVTFPALCWWGRG